MSVNGLRVAPYGVNSYTNISCLVESIPGAPGVTINYRPYPVITWEDNTPFLATLEFMRSYSTFRVRDSLTGREYNIFPSDVNDYILDRLVVGSQITGRWWVVKKNTSYGVALAR